MAKHRIAPELRERAIMHLIPPYNWTLSQVADDIGVGTTTVHSEAEFSSLPPSRIVPMLADRGIYQASESTFYRKRQATAACNSSPGIASLVLRLI